MVIEDEAVGKRSPGRSPGPRYWLIAKGGHWETHGGTEALTIDHEGEKALAVFSGEGEAEMFLWLNRGMGSGWWLRESEAGELASMLLGAYAGFRRVVLDPAPGITTEETAEPFILSRERFVRLLVRTSNAASRPSPRLPPGYRRATASSATPTF